MSYGEPNSVPGECNARLHIGDNFGDNHATMRCQLEPGHEGQHRERYETETNGEIIVTWDRCEHAKERAVDAKVRELVERWERATILRSDPADDHPVFRELVAMGDEAIKPLLRLLQARASWSCMALWEIVEKLAADMPDAIVAPTLPEEDCGRLDKIVAMWLEWGRENYYLEHE